MSTQDTVRASNVFWDLVEGRKPLSPASQLLGLKFLSVDAEAGTVETEFKAIEQFLNPGGAIHGGFITAMLDDTMSYAGTAYLNKTNASPSYVLPTLEIKTSFMRPHLSAACSERESCCTGAAMSFSWKDL